MTAIRQPVVAGSFYPADPDVLSRQLTGFLSEADNAPAETRGLPKALIGPHAGYAYSGAVAARAYARLAAARGRIRRVVLIGPSHYLAFKGLAIDAAQAWRTPAGTVALDAEAVAALRRLPMVGELDAAYQREHSLEVHVPFLQHVLGDFRLVPIVTGDAPAEVVANALEAVWGGEETLIVVSTDLSHYLDYAACQAIDARTAAAIERLDGEAIGTESACGRVSVRGLLLAARRLGMSIERLDLRNSGDTAGPRDRVVGYGAWVLYPAGVPAGERDDAQRTAIEAQRDNLLGLVRTGIGIGFQTGQPGRVNPSAPLPALLAAQGAAFVTLKRNGQLRGCIGSSVATRPLAADVVDHAFNAAFRDPRFVPLGLLEASALELSVSVLTTPAAMQFAGEDDLVGQLRPGVDGLIISDRGRGALFLPIVWEEIGDPRLFVRYLKQKAGLPGDYFSPSFTARRFRTIEVKGHMVESHGAVVGRHEYAWRVGAA